MSMISRPDKLDGPSWFLAKDCQVCPSLPKFAGVAIVCPRPVADKGCTLRHVGHRAESIVWMKFQVVTALCGTYSNQSPGLIHWPGDVAGSHTFVCEQMTTLLVGEQMTTLLSVCRRPHFYLWADDHTFVCEQMTILLSVSRWSHFCLWAYDHICFRVRKPHFCLCFRWHKAIHLNYDMP